MNPNYPPQNPNYPQQLDPNSQQPQVQYPAGFQPTQSPGSNPVHQAPATGGFFIPSQEVIQTSYQHTAEIKQKIAEAKSGGGKGKLKFFELHGPNGQKWSSAYPGFTTARAIYIVPSWAEGKLNYFERTKHFWKSAAHPQGTSINGAGPDSLVSKAYKLALDQGMKSPWLRPQLLYVYQGFPYEYDLMSGSVNIDPSQCIQSDGSMRPMLLEAVSGVHTAIQDLTQARQFVQMFHPDFGRPILIKKTKTGVDPMNVDYSVLDLNQQPLADAFRPGLNYLYQLDDLFKPATVEEQINAIRDCGLPMPAEAGGFQGQSQTGYQCAPQQNWAGPLTPPPQQFAPAPQQQWQPQPPPMTPVHSQFGNQQQPSYQQQPMPPSQNPYQQQPAQQGPGWPPPPAQGGFTAPYQQQGPKPLPQQNGGPAGHTPMLNPNQYGPPPQQQYGQNQQPQQQPLTPQDMQAAIKGNGGIPF